MPSSINSSIIKDTVTLFRREVTMDGSRELQPTVVSVAEFVSCSDTGTRATAFDDISW